MSASAGRLPALDGHDTEEQRAYPAPEPIGGRDAPPVWDVVVIGGGNAGLVAAIAAREHSRHVLLIERAPAWQRGGNSRHTRNIRCVHGTGDAYTPGTYSFDELYGDLCAVGSGPSDEHLAELTVSASESVPRWMSARGVSWQRALTGTLQLERTNRFFLGGGKALVNHYYRVAADAGITLAYDTVVEGFELDGDAVSSVTANLSGRREGIACRSVICAAGGFEANLDWLARYHGDAAYNFIVRGPAHNDGTVLQALYDLGADVAGEERGFHGCAVDARSPRFDGGIATRLDTIPFGVVVNERAERFADEGEELWPKRYAIWGGRIAGEANQIAYSVWDSKVVGRSLPPMYPPFVAETHEALGSALGLDPNAFAATLRAYNDAVHPGTFDPKVLDNCRTEGLTPPKSHWAQRIDAPPYYGVAMRPGITFTYRGVRVDEEARVVRSDGTRFANVFAAGEIMSGNVLSSGYLAGFGLTIGTVWGRIAGTRAAEVAASGVAVV